MLGFAIIVLYTQPLFEKTSPLHLKMNIFTGYKWAFKLSYRVQSGYLFEHSIYISSFVLLVLCLWVLWSWGSTSGRQSYWEEMINSTLQWFPQLWVKLNVCFLVKAHQKMFFFSTYTCAVHPNSVLLFHLTWGKGDLLQWFRYYDKPSQKVLIYCILLRKHLEKP